MDLTGTDTESGSIKVTNHVGILSGYFLVLDKEELEGRNMKLLVMFISGQVLAGRSV